MEIITAVGVIASLLFVATEIRANTRAVRGQTLQGISDQSLTVNMALVSVPELRQAFSKAMAGQVVQLTPDEEDVLASWYAGLLRIAENRYRQRKLGTFDDVRAFGGSALAYRVPFFKVYWEHRRSTFPNDFAAFVDRTMIPLVTDSVPRIIPRIP